MNGTIARLTFSTLLSRWRGIMLALLPLAFLALAVLFRFAADGGGANGLLRDFNLATIVPLVALIVGTGAISTEIDDGSIVYLLMKPVRRGTIIVTKFVVAVGATILFSVLPTAIASVVLLGEFGQAAAGYTIAVAIASTVYCALFLVIGVMTKQAVIVGLGYILVVEGMIASIISNAGVISIQSWAAVIAAKVTGASFPATTGIWTSVALASIVAVGSLWYASRRLRGLSVA